MHYIDRGIEISWGYYTTRPLLSYEQIPTTACNGSTPVEPSSIFVANSSLLGIKLTSVAIVSSATAGLPITFVDEDYILLRTDRVPIASGSEQVVNALWQMKK